MLPAIHSLTTSRCVVCVCVCVCVRLLVPDAWSILPLIVLWQPAAVEVYFSMHSRLLIAVQGMLVKYLDVHVSYYACIHAQISLNILFTHKEFALQLIELT